MHRRARTPRLLALAGVGALHVWILGLWLSGSRLSEAPGPAQSPLLVRLLTIVEPPPAPVDQARPERSRAPSAPRWTPPATLSTTGQQDASPLFPDPAPADPATPPRPASLSTRPADAPPLNLSLPPAATREAGRPRRPNELQPRSIESRLARDLGTTDLREESLGHGRIRLRQGQRCVELRDARMAQIDPFNQRVSPVPKQAEDCAR